MTVAYNALSLRPGHLDGGATYSLNLLRHLLVQPDLDFVVFVRTGEDRVPEGPNVRIRQVAVRGGAAGRVAAETAWLGRALRASGASVLLSPNESLPLASPCPVVVIAQNVVYHCDPPAQPFTGATVPQRLVTGAQFAYYRRRMRRAYERATAVVACSRAAAELLAERAGLDLARTTVVLSGSDPFSLVLPAQPVPREERLLVVSALAPYKKLDRTLELFAEIRARRPGVSLSIVGSDWRGFRSRVERDIRRLGLSEAVSLPGPVSSESLAGLYASSLALVHLSTCESFGLPAVEAMRFGLPVVAATQGPSPEIAAGAALLVDPDDPVSAGGAVADLLDSTEGLEELRRLGLERAAQLTWERTAQGVANVLRSVVEAQRSGRVPSRS